MLVPELCELLKKMLVARHATQEPVCALLSHITMHIMV